MVAKKSSFYPRKTTRLVRMPLQQYRLLKQFCKAYDRQMCEIIGEAVKELLERQGIRE